MEAVLQLLNDYVSGLISVEDFVGDYLQLWREIRDEQWSAINSCPGLKENLNKLGEDRFAGRMSVDEYVEASNRLLEPVTDCRVRPLSRESEIISHLMVEADAYEADPETRREYPQYIGEEELLVEVKKGLAELKALGW